MTDLVSLPDHKVARVLETNQKRIAYNKQFSLMVYPNRTHSIKERKNTTRHLRELMTQYLLQYLPPTASAVP